MIFVLVPTDFKLKFWTVFGVEISKFLSFATRQTSNFDLKKENGHQFFSMIAPYPMVPRNQYKWVLGKIINYDCIINILTRNTGESSNSTDLVAERNSVQFED